MKYLTALLGIFISWSVLYAPIVHADNLNQSNHTKKAVCNTENTSQVNCCFANNMSKNINISSDIGSSSVKTKITNGFKKKPLSINFNLNLLPKKNHKPLPTYKPFSTLITGSTVKLE